MGRVLPTGRGEYLPIPNFQTLMRPLLELMRSNNDWERAALRDWLADRFELTAEEGADLLPSGRQRRFDNRVAWSTTHLYQAGLLERPRRGVNRLTERGRQVLRDHPDRIDMSVLNEFEDYREFRQPSCEDSSPDKDGIRRSASPVCTEATLEETIGATFEQIESALGDELLQRLVEGTPEFFEQVVVDSCSPWATGDLVAMRGNGLDRQATWASMGRSARMFSASMRCISKPSDVIQTEPWDGRECRASWVRCTALGRRRACSSRRLGSAGRPRNTPRLSLHAWCSPAVPGSPDS